MTRSPRRWDSSRTAGEMPWALKITVVPSGTWSSSSRKIAPLRRSASTTSRLWTISFLTYTGVGQTWRANSTMSMARSTPAQKPRGPARTISFSVSLLIVDPSVEEERHAQDSGVGVEPPVGLLDVAVGDVLEAIPRRQLHPLSQEIAQPGAGLQDEREVRPDLRDVEAGPAHPGQDLHIRKDRRSAQEMVAQRYLQPFGGRAVGLQVVLEPGLEAGLQRPPEEPGADGIQREHRKARHQVDEGDVGAGLSQDSLVPLDVVLGAAPDFEGEDLRAARVLLGRIGRGGGSRPAEQRGQRGAKPEDSHCHALVRARALPAQSPGGRRRKGGGAPLRGDEDLERLAPSHEVERPRNLGEAHAVGDEAVGHQRLR